MRRTSEFSRPEAHVRRALQGGFTLLELLLVFGLLAMLIGLVAPAGQRALDAAAERARLRQVADVLRALPYEAFSKGEAISIDATALRERLTELPDNWRLTLDQPLNYGPVGAASGGKLLLQAPDGAVHRWSIQPITGELSTDGGKQRQ